jgi:hypothetical protein
VNTPVEPGENLGKVIGAWVAGAVIAVAVVGGSVDGLLAAAASGKLEASAADYMTFGQLYLATLLLSATLTLAISVYAVPALDGTRVHWALPLGIVVAGAFMTGLPVQSTGANGPVGILAGAFKTFARYYGEAFTGGVIVGLAGAGIVYAVAKQSKVPAGTGT